MKTWLHASHFSHFTTATSVQSGPWATELVQLQRVNIFAHPDSPGPQPKLKITRKFFSTQHTKFSERSSQDPTKFSSGGNSLLLWPALGQLTDSLKESFFWSTEGQEVLWTQAGEELEFTVCTSQTCCYSTWKKWVTGEMQREWWQLYVQTEAWLPSQPTMISFPSAIKSTQLWGVAKGGRRFISYWHAVLLNLDLPQIVLLW